MIVETQLDNKEIECTDIVSEEDKQISNEIDLFMANMKILNDEERLSSINDIKKLLQMSTSSMTSVPKPLKFIYQNMTELEKIYFKLDDMSIIKKPLCDLISVIAMLEETNDFEKIINYCLSGTLDNVSAWGHEYVRHICLSATKTYQHGLKADNPIYPFMIKIFDDIGPFLLSHNGENELCDVLADISNLHWLLFYIDESNYSRICLYLEGTLFYTPKESVESTVNVLFDIYFKFEDFIPALKLAVRYSRVSEIMKCANSVKDVTLKNQMAFFLCLVKYNEARVVDSPGKEFPFEIIGNCNFSKYFIRMARDLDALQPRLPEDVFKCGSLHRSMPDRSKAQLASVFANGFVHAGFKKDYGISTDGNAWIYSNKTNGLISATASFGLINMWDIDIGLGLIDKFFYADEDEVKAGAYLACGIICSGQAHECEPPIALLSPITKEDNSITRPASIMALGIAYAGTNNEVVLNVLKNALVTPPLSPAIVGYTLYSIGLVAVGTKEFSLVEKMANGIKAIPQEQWENEFGLVYAFLGMGFVQLGQNNFCEQEDVKNLIASNFEGSFSQLGISILEMFYEDENGLASAVDNLLSSIGVNIDSYLQAMCDQTREKASWANDLVIYKNGIEVISLAVKCCNDDISVSMMTRILDHIMRFGEAGEKRAVPLALSLLYVSNPSVAIIETLAKYSHDIDQDVVLSSIIAMGIVGAGTNNARLSSQLKNLATHCGSPKNNNYLFAVRIAQCFLFMGKGTLSLSPFVCDRFICKKAVLVAVIGFLISFLDSSKIILGNYTHHIYMIVPAISSRMLVTYDENLEPLTVSVRVGQAVDLAGQTGTKRSITGFQTHNTPVLLAHGQRAELVTDEYIPLTPYLEGVVILKRNPDYVSR